MDRRAAAVAGIGTLVLLLLAAPSFGESPGKGPARSRTAGPEKKGTYRLEEVKIVGSAEHPGVLFFLPRAKFRLLPVRTGQDWSAALLRDDREKGEVP